MADVVGFGVFVSAWPMCLLFAVVEQITGVFYGYLDMRLRGEDVVVCYYDASFWAGLNGNLRKAVKRFPGGRPVLRLSVPYGYLPRKQCINVQES